MPVVGTKTFGSSQTAVELMDFAECSSKSVGGTNTVSANAVSCYAVVQKTLLPLKIVFSMYKF